MRKGIILGGILLLSSLSVHAEEGYSLREREVLLDSRPHSSAITELFTERDGRYYRQWQSNEQGQWIIRQIEEISPPLGGLKEESVESLAVSEAAIRRRLEKLGMNPDVLPERLDLSKRGLLPPVGKQHEDSCVGWATGYYLRTFQQASDIGWQVGNNPRRIFSPSFIYNQINEGVDEGSNLQDAGNLLQKVGAATLYDFPYQPGDYLTKPSEAVLARAASHKIREWRILYTKNDSEEYIIRKTKEYLNTGDLPIAGINIGFKWKYPLMQDDGNAIVTTEQYTSGGHAVAVVGYDDTLATPEGVGAFKIVNSYGKNWGNDGYIYMTYPAFAHAMRSAFVYTDLMDPAPADEVLSLPLSINDTVDFQIEFQGSGSYDLRIEDPQGQILKEERARPAQSGQNLYRWDGSDSNGQSVPQGSYRLRLIPYHKGQAGSPIVWDFDKSSKLSSAQAKSYSLFGDRYRIELTLTAKSDAVVNIRCGENELLQQELTKGATFRYTIDPAQLSEESLSIDVQ